jgi:CHAT domain-containing protein
LALGDVSFDEIRPSGAPSPSGAASKPATAKGLVQEEAVYRGARSACGEFQSVHFSPLPASKREVEEIEALLKSEMARQGGGTIVLTGAAASEGEFKAQAPGRRIVHLATHGFFLGSECRSWLSSIPGPSDGQAGAENPLILSGVALAGANHRAAASADEEDGILSADEIAAMNLGGVEWAVLSACDTGRGEARAGEGLFGLKRSFHVAGAGTVILSLWPVEDEAARAWMESLYRRHFLDRVDTMESVRAASLQALRDRREKKLSTHPFYWAAFIATGDWR